VVVVVIWMGSYLGDIIVVAFHVLQAELLGRSDVPVGVSGHSISRIGRV
jgi:hypothetical protein